MVTKLEGATETVETPRILFVDDEVSVLNSLRRGLRLHCRDWQVEFCSSPSEALKLMPEFDPWVVVSDKRMPEMDGADFLRKVSKLSPEVIRVLLTGDISLIVALEVADIAHMLIAKPFEIESLVQLLYRAQCLRKLPASLGIRKQLGSIKSVPVLPNVYQQLSSHLKSDEVDTHEIARIISQDPSILAKIIQLANSSFLGFSGPAVNAHDAVVRLGVELIKNLTLCFSLFKQSETVDEKMRNQLSTESMDVAMISRLVSLACGGRRLEAEKSFVLGLLHNVGMLQASMSNIQLENDANPIQPFEVDIIGAYLLSLWEFDSEFVLAVLYQHIPEAAENVSKLCCILHVAKVIYEADKLGISALDEHSGLNTSLLQSQGLLDDVMVWVKEYENNEVK